MHFDLRALVALSALLATSASAQHVYLPGPGGYAGYGNGSPERLLFPDAADPEVFVGLRLSPHVDLQAGYTSTSNRQTYLSRDEVRAFTTADRTNAAILSAGYADRLGRSLVRARLSLGYDDFAYSSATYRPDSTTLYTPDGPERGYGLGYQSGASGRGEYVHAGASVSAGLPVDVSRVRILPTVGLMGTLSSTVDGAAPAQGARWMPYAQLPISVRVKKVAVTYLLTGGVTKGTYRRGDLTFSPTPRASSNWAVVAEGTLRVDF